MPTSLQIDDKLNNRVNLIANLREKSPHWIICEAIRQFVEREEMRDDFGREALASWGGHHANGRHLTGVEVEGWLQDWGTGKDMPECHD